MTMEGAYTLKIRCENCKHVAKFSGEQVRECRKKARLAGWLIDMAKTYAWCRVCKRRLGLGS